MRQLVMATCVVTMLWAAALAPAQQSDEPIDASQLLPFLPNHVEGFAAGKPKGSPASAMGVKLSVVSRVYRKGGPRSQQTVTVKITDGSSNPFFAAAYADAEQYATDGGDGSEKAFTLDGYPAIERYANGPKEGSLAVLVAGHDLVEITIDGLERDTLQQWWKLIDTQGLAALRR